MVSFQSPFSFSEEQRSMISVFEDSSSSSSSTNKKRNREDDTEAEQVLNNVHKRNHPKSFYDLGVHLESPLPSEWQRFLDIKSGEIHFYNTHTHKRTLKDPSEVVLETEPVPRSPDGHMSLDLELNLPCGSSRSSMDTDNKLKKKKQQQDSDEKPQINCAVFFMKKKDLEDQGRQSPPLSLSSSSPRSSLEGDDQPQEMVATVCTRCHMLVMLCKSSPACPNCKFMHPPNHSPPYLFKPRLSLLC
ncbi:hypothetical protein Dimus_024898 [Dionaea muscipula]